MKDILEILERNAKASPDDIAAMTGRTGEEVRDAIYQLEEQRVIVGYHAVVDWGKTQRDLVVALIEVKVTPQLNRGFDSIAEKICRYSQVKACYLMSGCHDLMVIVEEDHIREAARFVSEKLSAIEGVTGTVTHFILKKYKDQNTVFDAGRGDNREAIVL